MAKRLLLTLLALFGLAAQLAPAQARVGTGAASEVGAALLAATQDPAATAVSPASGPVPAAPPRLRAGFVAAPYAAPTAPSVHTGIDRARE